MSSSQIQTSYQTTQQMASGLPINRPQESNKPPTPSKPPPRPPPPPPKNSSQLLSQSSISLSGTGLPSSVTPGLLNNGSMNSLNSAGRCNHVLPNMFIKHAADNCSSRSSVSSHSPLQHHHLQHLTNNVNVNGGVGIGCQQVTCSHQQPISMGCICSGPNLQYTNFANHSDNGTCNHVSYGQDSCGFIQMAQTCHNGCCGVGSNHHAQLHQLNPSIKCQSQINGSNVSNSSGRSTGQSPSSSAAGRNAIFSSNGENLQSNLMPSCITDASSRNHCQTSHLPPAPPPHNHHHNHNGPIPPSSNLTSLQPLETTSSHRCNVSQSNITVPPIANDNQLMQRPLLPSGGGGYCNHVIHRNGVSCGHHHQTNCCDHHVQASHVVQHQQVSGGHECANCSHSHTSGSNVASQHHDCGLMMMGKTCVNAHLHHHHYNFQQELMATNRSSDASNNDSLLSTTAHTHNLSDSSTTTHTSSVAVKHQPHFQNRPLTAKGLQSNSSQHYEYVNYGASSTSSDTARLSNYHTQNYEESLSLIPTTKNQNQPLPLPPNLKSRPASPVINTASLSPQMNSNNNNIGNSNKKIPIIKTQLLNKQELQHNQSLPKKLLSPNVPSSKQNTALTNSLNVASQPITRVTSQAGVQNPLPSSDVPPPLPPLNPGNRQQPLKDTVRTRIQQLSNTRDTKQNPIVNFIKLNIGSRSTTAKPKVAERKTEVLTKQVELKLEEQQKSGEPLVICSKCGDKVITAKEACKAMGEIFHKHCFVCYECKQPLVGKTFYPVRDRVFCEADFTSIGHIQALEKCATCLKPISEMLIPAMGKSYHPECFKCCVCNKCLDGIPFTIDAKNKIYCANDYHSIYSPKCGKCEKSIGPIDGTSKTVRVSSMGKDYHIDCFCCEDCGLQLTDEAPSRNYPLDNHLLCQECHINRLS